MKSIPLPALALVCLALLVPARAPAQIAVSEHTLQQREAEPGETYGGTIVVTNTANEPHEVKLYQTDYLFYADGRTIFGEPGSAPRSNAEWITFNPSFVTVPPHSQATVAYTVSVPSGEDAPLTGSYWSVIMVEPVAPGSAESLKAAPNEEGIGIVTRIRYGVQIVTHIAGSGEVRLDFADPRIRTGPEGGRVLEFDVRNVGERSVPLDVRLELYDAAGAAAGRFDATVRILHPGTSLRQRFDLGPLAGGTYTALVAADTGADIFGAQYTLQF
ncbi:MAG TPA: hypothetical protein VF188_03860 [Longimicrobiales bacterium]